MTNLAPGGRSLSESRERHRARNTLVVAQVAMALVLLIGSGLMIRTFLAMRNVQPGFVYPEEILTLRVSIPSAQAKEPERAARMFYDMVQGVGSIAGVQSAALTNSATMDGSRNNDPIFVEDRPGEADKLPPLRRYKHISPGYFKTMGNPLVAGRDFQWTDVLEKRPVVMISENIAREYWGNPALAVGKRVRENPKGIWREVVGVAGNEQDDGVDRPAAKIVYWPYLKSDFWVNKVDVRRSLVFAIRSNRTGSSGLLKDVQAAVWAVNRDLPLANVRTLKEIQERSMARTSFTLVMLMIASAMALLLGLVGIYGVISYSITQRTREIGIRIALGASQEKVRGMFVKEGLLLAGIGLGCGVVIALPLTRLMTALLFEVTPLDPLTYAAVSGVLATSALLATYVPSRRAARVEPVEALRAE
jgi:predicted permease